MQLTCGFVLFCQIIEQEVQQHRMHGSFGLWVVAGDLAAHQLDSPYAAATELNLPAVANLERLLAANATVQWWTVLEHSQVAQHLRHAIV